MKSTRRLFWGVFFTCGALYLPASALAQVPDICAAGTCIGPNGGVVIDTNENGMPDGDDRVITIERVSDGDVPVFEINSPWNCNPDAAPANRNNRLEMDSDFPNTLFRPRTHGNEESADWSGPAPEVFNFYAHITGQMRFVRQSGMAGPFDGVQVYRGDTNTTASFGLVEYTDPAPGGAKYITYPWGQTYNFTKVRSDCGPRTPDGGVIIPQIWVRLTDTNGDGEPDSIVFDTNNDGVADTDLPRSPMLAGNPTNSRPFSALFPRAGGVSIPTLPELAMILLVLSLLGAGWIVSKRRINE